MPRSVHWLSVFGAITLTTSIGPVPRISGVAVFFLDSANLEVTIVEPEALDQAMQERVQNAISAHMQRISNNSVAVVGTSTINESVTSSADSFGTLNAPLSTQAVDSVTEPAHQFSTTPVVGASTMSNDHSNIPSERPLETTSESSASTRSTKGESHSTTVKPYSSSAIREDPLPTTLTNPSFRPTHSQPHTSGVRTEVLKSNKSEVTSVPTITPTVTSHRTLLSHVARMVTARKGGAMNETDDGIPLTSTSQLADSQTFGPNVKRVTSSPKALNGQDAMSRSENSANRSASGITAAAIIILQMFILAK
jgi:hypothetical protein